MVGDVDGWMEVKWCGEEAEARPEDGALALAPARAKPIRPSFDSEPAAVSRKQELTA